MTTPRPPWVYQLLAASPAFVMVGLLVLYVRGSGTDVWALAWWLAVPLYLSAPVWGEPVRNWGRFREVLWQGSWCHHGDWTEWQPIFMDDGETCWCRDCGWVVKRWPGRVESGLHPVPWRFRAGLARGCGPNVDEAWKEPAPDEEGDRG